MPNFHAPGPTDLRPEGASLEETARELEAAPIPPAVVRRERRLVSALMAAVIAVAAYGYLSIPTMPELVETACTAEDDQDRIRAMNALIRRGYWKERAFKEFELFMKGSPKSMPQFVADMHGDLLKPDRRAWSR